MKRTGKITGIVLVIMMVFSINISAQGRGMRAGDFSHMQGYGRGYGFKQSNDSLRHSDPLALRRGPVNRNMRGMGPMHQGMPGMGFGPEGRGRFNSPASGQVPGLGRLENLPGITDKQKKDIIDLRYKQLAEMEKFRVDMQSKMQAMREEQRKKILELLTEEQKKLIEAVPQKPNANAPK